MAAGASATAPAIALTLAAFFITCTSGAGVGVATPDSHFEEDTTVLLQGELVQAKSSEQAKKRQTEVVDSKPRGAVSPACAAAGKDPLCQSCDGGDPLGEVAKATEEDLPSALPEKTEPAELPAVISLADESTSELNDSAKADAEVPSFILRSFLKLLIFLLFVDGVKRYLSEGISFSQPPEEASVPLDADFIGEDKAAVRKAAADAFTRAALLGDARDGEALLEKVVAVDEVDVWGSSLLHAAAKGGSARMVNLLLERGAKIDQLDAWDETPLHLAARGGCTEACELLLDFGASLESRNMQDRAALEIAATEGKEGVCELLLARGAAVPEHGGPPFLQELLRERRADDDHASDRAVEPEVPAEQEEEDIRDYGRDGFEHNSFGQDGFE